MRYVIKDKNKNIINIIEASYQFINEYAQSLGYFIEEAPFENELINELSLENKINKLENENNFLKNELKYQQNQLAQTDEILIELYELIGG